MTAVGGPIQEVSIGSQAFAVASDADASLKMGGWKTTAHRNGNGSTRYTGEREAWSLSNIELAIDSSSQQLVYLQSIANGMEPVDCTITLVDGTVYQGSGVVVDEHPFSTSKATMNVTLMGSGALSAQTDYQSFLVEVP